MSAKQMEGTFVFGFPARIGLARRISGNSFHLLLRLLLGAGTALVVVGVVLSALGVEDYGVYVSVGFLSAVFLRVEGVFHGTACRFLGCAMGKGAVGDLSSVWSAVVLFALAVALCVWVTGELVGMPILTRRLSIPPNRMVAARIVFHAGMLISVIKLLQSAFVSLVFMKERMAYFSFVGVLESVLALGSAWLLGRVPAARLETYVCFLVLTSVIVLCSHVVYCRRAFPRVRFQSGRWRAHLPDIVRFFALRLLTGMGNAVKIDGVAILVNVFAGVAPSASWGVATQIRLAFQAVGDCFQQASSPTIYKRMSAGDLDGTRRFLVWEISLSLLLVAVPVALWLALSDRILPLWLGESRPAFLAPLAACSALWSLVDVTSGPLSVTILATGRIATFQIAMFLFAVLGFAGVWLFLANGGPVWGAMAVVVVANALSLAYRFAHIRLTGILRVK